MLDVEMDLKQFRIYWVILKSPYLANCTVQVHWFSLGLLGVKKEPKNFLYYLLSNLMGKKQGELLVFVWQGPPNQAC